MFRFVFSVFLVGFVAAASSKSILLNDVSVQVVTATNRTTSWENLREFNVISLQKSADNRGVVTYTHGDRVPGDRLVGYGYDNVRWPTVKNVQLTLTYPRGNVGAVITHVKVVVKQSSNEGGAYILEGGAGQRRILILIEAFNTYIFNYEANIYGI